MKKSRPQFSPGEWKIMRALWSAGRATTVELAHATRRGGPRRETVRMLLHRMTGRGLVKVVSHGGGHGLTNVYEACLTFEEAIDAKALSFAEKDLKGDLEAIRRAVRALRAKAEELAKGESKAAKKPRRAR